jgi:hypothetical protein
MEFTQEQRVDAASKVYAAVLAGVGGSHYATKDEIISAHNWNAIDLQCRLTCALALLRGYRDDHKDRYDGAADCIGNARCAWCKACDDLLGDGEI